MKTKITQQLWFILMGMKVKALMPASDRINYYKSQRDAMNRFGITIKN